MIKLFLKAKHWQIFILMVGVPFLFQIVTIIYVIVMNSPLFAFSTFPIFMLLYVIIFFGWFWSIGVGLHKSLPKQHNLSVRKFKIFFFIPLIYITLLMFSMMYLGIFSEFPPPDEMIGISLALIIPLHLFSIFCMFYMLYFCSKTIKSIELNREVDFSDYTIEFFLLWFYFIVIWILQPKINKIYFEKIIGSPNFEPETLNQSNE
jgi:membrane protease YdiL (CAAX protease family)